MTNMKNRLQSRTAQLGLSLIELLIALTLSTLLILGIIEIFASTRAAFAASEGLARVQENGRFSMDFLRRDLRMAGHLGCLNEFGHINVSDQRFYSHFVNEGAPLSGAALPLRIDLPVQAFDFTGSIPGSTYSIASSTPAAATSAAAWTPALPGALGLIDVGPGAVIDGSDVVIVRYFDEAPITLAAGGAVGEGGVGQTTGTVWTGPATGGIAEFAVYGMTNCRVASLFQVTSVNVPGGVVGSAGGANDALPSGAYWDAKETYGVGSMMFRYRAVVYYVGIGANDGEPSLFRRTLPETPTNSADGIAFGPPEEIVEGVEFMQVLLATASAPTALTGKVDDVTSYQSPTELLAGATTEDDLVARQRLVAGMRMSVLQRSPNGVPGAQPASPTIVVGDVTVTVPVDERIRQVYENIITLRNRQRA